MKRLSIIALAVLIAIVGTAGVAAAIGTNQGPGAGWSRALLGGFRPATPGVTAVGTKAARVSGADRYETAVAISNVAWDPEFTITVFLAAGTNYPDALTGGPTTILDGPVLLVQPNALPTVTGTEIQRLAPCYIVAFGGPSAISDAVILAASQYANPNQLKCPEPVG